MLEKLLDNTGTDPGEYFIWSVPGRPVSVHLNLNIVTQLNAGAGAGLGTLPRRGLEVGGLLLGRVRTPNDGQYIVAVEQIEPIDIEHVRGPSYILSPSDRDELFRRVRKHGKKAGKGLSVIGFYRSHTRPGLYMDEYDHDLMRSYFAHPSSVALLVRPTLDGNAPAGFFIWEDGEIHRASTYLEFPLNEKLLRGQAPVERSDEPAPQLPPVPAADPDGAIVLTISSPAQPRLAAAAAEPALASAAFKQAPAQQVRPSEAADSAETGKGEGESAIKRYLAWTAAAALLLIVSGALYRPFAHTDTNRPHNVFALNAEPTQSGLRLTWDQSNPLIAQHSKGILSITDGDDQKHIELDQAQLRSGSILYWPTSADVNFRLQIGEFDESLRAISPKLPPAPEPARSQTAQTQPAQTQPAQVATAIAAGAPTQSPSPRTNHQNRSRIREVRPAVLPGERPRPTIRSQELPTPPPAELAAGTASLDRPAPVDRPAVRPPAAAFADVEQVRDSGFKRTVSAIFGKNRDDDSFVPPRPVRQVTPELPASVKVAGDTRVSVKVSLDETGRVKGTDLVSRSVDARLANAAMDAAKRWRFEPARQQQKNTSSSVILHFRFNRDSGS